MNRVLVIVMVFRRIESIMMKIIISCIHNPGPFHEYLQETKLYYFIEYRDFIDTGDRFDDVLHIYLIFYCFVCHTLYHYVSLHFAMRYRNLDHGADALHSF